DTPGWKRAQSNKAKKSRPAQSRYGKGPASSGKVIDGELITKSTSEAPSLFAIGERVFHQKFGYGSVKSIEGNKLTIEFSTGTKRVLDSFVERH
ncbi:MAG: ATP-dependent DNA helicase, partial [Cohaesibacter sp.]|nr:ATP-dependent DNA helicase [Cohaesibacter sp.]